jgi:superfamily II DNA helicase RecQ
MTTNQRFYDALSALHTIDVDNAMSTIREAIEERQHARHIQLRDERWQVLAGGLFMTGKDVFVITRTGSGKTFCYQGPAMADLDGILLVLCGLINLQDDQVKSAKKNGIKAVALNESTLSSMHGLVDQVSSGAYEVVLMSPEFCSASNHNWCRMTGATEFSRRLRGIVVDEAHLIHAWRDFRPAYANIHQLRIWYPTVPFMVLTATMTPFVRTFVHTSLRLNNGTAMIHRKVDRHEIYLSVTVEVGAGGPKVLGWRVGRYRVQDI